MWPLLGDIRCPGRRRRGKARVLLGRSRRLAPEVHIRRANRVFVVHVELTRAASLPIGRSLRRAGGCHPGACRSISQPDVADLWTLGGQGQPAAHGRIRRHVNAPARRDARADADTPLGKALLVHLVENGKLLSTVLHGARETRHILGILPQRVDEVVEKALLSLDETPIDAPRVNETIEVVLGEIRPLRAHLLEGRLSRHAKVERRTQHAGTLGAQAGRELGARSRTQLALDEADGTLELSRVLEPLDLRRKAVIQVAEIVVRSLELVHSERPPCAVNPRVSQA